MDYIPQSPTNCSKGNIKCVLQCTKIPEKQTHGYMFQTKCSSTKHSPLIPQEGFPISSSISMKPIQIPFVPI